MAEATPLAPTVLDLPGHERLVSGLRRALGGAAAVQLIETHISSVLVTDAFAYKLKKPVALAFLDFSSLGARQRACEEELRLNRRFAPALYVDVVPIGGTLDAPTLGTDAPPIEYAVRMRAFRQDALGSAAIARGALTPQHVDALAAAIAEFHGRAEVAAPDAPYGTTAAIGEAALENCREVGQRLRDPDHAGRVRAVLEWTQREHARLEDIFERRHATGFVRECHGDLHLGNIVLLASGPCPFDGIEFNAALRWIDVMSDVAFLYMDLHDHGRPDLAYRLLNAYLERTGDHDGLTVLQFYVVYRAMVRAKVAALRLDQVHATDAPESVRRELDEYLDLAQRFTAAGRPSLIITHGLSGSGKSSVTQSLLEFVGAIRIRTDVERKRLARLAPEARSDSRIAGGLYTEAGTRATYEAVAHAATAAIAAGWVVIADGTFLRVWQRDRFRTLAREMHVPFRVLDLRATPAVLRERIAQRQREGAGVSEADVQVLEHQLATSEPLRPDELPDTIACAADQPLDDVRAAALRSLSADLERSTAPAPLRARSDGGIAERVRFLQDGSHYPSPARNVTTIETHLSWVFLTDADAWKLKKPVHSAYLDLTTSEARRRNAETEVRLNRRLAPEVYRGVVALRRRDDGSLTLHDEGEPVDWLVHMQRLPHAQMLDALIRDDRITEAALRALVDRLCAFYAAAPREEFSAAAYRTRFVEGVRENTRELGAPVVGVPPGMLASLDARLHVLLEGHIGAMLARRAERGCIVEAHGDLRPQHVWLGSPLAIIDCLEFSRDLRLLDPAEEIMFLAVECEHLGAPAVASAVVDLFLSRADDDVPRALLHFYASYRACVRAKLAAWHLLDPALRDPRWHDQALAYLRIAERHLDACLAQA